MEVGVEGNQKPVEGPNRIGLEGGAVEPQVTQAVPQSAHDNILSGASMPPVPEHAPSRIETAPAASEAAVARPEAKPKWSPDQYYDPKPVGFVMKTLAVLNDWVMVRGLPLLRNIPLLNRFPPARGLLDMSIELPASDLERLREVVNPRTASFIGLNHPEVGTDGIIDKEIARLAAPKVATFADTSIVNLHPTIQKFWLANNMISNAPGGKGKQYAVKAALRGDGVLMHPEGMVAWRSDRMFEIFPGIAAMAMDAAVAARASANPEQSVYIAPVVFKYRFVGDVSRGLSNEMNYLEKRLGLASGKGLPVQERFFELQKNLLLKQEERFGVPEDLRNQPLTAANYFARQQALHDRLEAEVTGRYGPGKGTGHHRLFNLEKVARATKGISKEVLAEDVARLKEMRRNIEFRPEIYARETITQEEMAESLKRIKRYHVNDTFMEVAKNYLPFAVGRRMAHLRVAEPIDVAARLAEAGGDSPALRAELLKDVAATLQARLDLLGKELEPQMARFARPNPFFVGKGGVRVQ